ncbi:MAG: hypothetical protein ABI171_07350, partial [Collimonas sp.]|uniref:hypothetical protein n=1 Tax=Collimonas sp. TaxID=1963772 RepID=UPI00326320B1
MLGCTWALIIYQVAALFILHNTNYANLSRPDNNEKPVSNWKLAFSFSRRSNNNMKYPNLRDGNLRKFHRKTSVERFLAIATVRYGFPHKFLP